MNLERQKENFKNHVAILKDYGIIKILDFKRPNSNEYRIRFLFEEDYYRLHISGDLGSLTATNYCNMTYEKFWDFVNNPEYFEGKIDCHERPIYVYDEDAARKELMDLVDRYCCREEMSEEYDWESEDEAVDDVINDMLRDFDSEHGIGNEGQEIAGKYFPDFWETAWSLGRKRTGIIELYMMAFRLAVENLEKGTTGLRNAAADV